MQEQLQPLDGESSFARLEVGRTEDGAPLVVLSGELDIATRSDLEQRLVLLAAGHPGRIVVDMADVTFIDSSGLNTLLTAHRRGAGLLVRSPSPAVRAVLDLVGVSGILDVAALADEEPPAA